MAKKRDDSSPSKKTGQRGQRYLQDTPRRYWIRTAIVTIGLFAVVLWFNYPSRGASAFLWAFGIAGAVLVYFIISYYLFRR
jgi:hypothetical protein